MRIKLFPIFPNWLLIKNDFRIISISINFVKTVLICVYFEAKGRIHTSTVGVVVSPKPAEINIEIDPKDLKMEAMAHGGPGGQHANKTQSAVRLTHLPTGLQVFCGDERQQHQNKTRALKNLKMRMYQTVYEERLAKRQANRKLQIGSSGRSERIRTYNFIQDRITDHRLSENFTGIDKFLGAASLADMIENLNAEAQIELLYEILGTNKNENWFFVSCEIYFLEKQNLNKFFIKSTKQKLHVHSFVKKNYIIAWKTETDFVWM